MVAIALANGRGYARVDDADADLVQSIKWKLVKDRKGRTGYAYGRLNGKQISMHRLLMPEAVRVDHRDGNGLNNQRENLRSCTHAENMRNVAPLRGRKYKGAYLEKRTGRWRARIQKPYSRQQIALGNYATEKEAAHAYDVAARELFGEFARLNFPDEIKTPAITEEVLPMAA